MSSHETLTPMFKWTGGKRKEIKHFQDLYPEYIKARNPESTYIEPFVGAGAVYFNLNHPGKNIINDLETDVINFYKQTAKRNPKMLSTITKMVKLYENGTHEQQEQEYYRLRNLDRDKNYNKIDKGIKAGRFYVVNQLAFSGMRRHNNQGQFNVPYGHYKNFNAETILSTAHINLLKNTKITEGSYEKTLKNNDTPETFFFIDPPYTRVMKKYGAGDEFGDEQQEQLAEQLLGLENAHFMIVIDKSEVTEKLYKNHIKRTYDLKYGVNIKNRFNTTVQHIVATNY